MPQVALPESIAGPWLVGLSSPWAKPALVERNLETGAEPLYIQLPKTSSEYPSESDYSALASVQEDGRIVYVPSGEPSVFTASPAEPDPRPILSAYVNPYSRQFIPDQRLFLASGLLALEELLPHGHESPYVNGPERRQRLELANLAGQRLGGFELGSNTVIPFDFNGSEVVALDRPCVESFMVTWGPGQPEPAPLPSGVCPTPRLVRISLARHGLMATLACPPSPPLGCPEPTISVTLHIRGKPVSSRGDTNDLFPGQTATLTAPLGVKSLRWLKRHAHTRVSVEFESVSTETSTISTRLR